MTACEPYRISLKAAPQTAGELSQLQQQWQALEATAPANFFLSWCWMSTWLVVYQPACQVVEICHEDQLVGLGLLTCETETRHRWLKSRVLRLAQTGNEQKDQIWIEYNDLLLHPDHLHSAPSAFVAFLMARNDWDEFSLGASLVERLKAYQHPELHPVERWEAPTYRVNLAGIRQQQKNYLASLSRNTRYQINRAKKAYEQHGPLQFEVLKDWQAIQPMLATLAQLHLQRWGEQHSGYSNPEFVRFHQALTETGVNSGQIQLCVLTHQHQVIGILYNFLYKNTVYFYLSGIEYGTDNKLKPGLLIHVFAIQYYLEQGYDFYDFMGGEAQYKSSLGECHGTLSVVSFQRNRLALRAEQWLRAVKNQSGIARS